MPNVLIVDDDQDLLELVCHMVEFSNMQAKCILSGSEVFPCLGSESFDLVLMDIFMGAFDGRELVKQIKSDPRYMRIPVLLYSAGEIDPASIIDCGADGFLKKPFEMSQLIGQMELMLAN